MTKISLTDATSLTNETSFISTLNANSATIETESDLFLSRDGTAPNSMEADFDMNSFQILNIGELDMNGQRIIGLDDAASGDEPVTYSQFIAGLSGSSTAFGNLSTGSITFALNGPDGIPAGVYGDIHIPFTCRITKVVLLANATGSAVIDIWKDTYANYPPTIADTICAASLPTITASNKYQDTTLTGWTTTLTAGDTIRFNVNSISGISKLTINLTITKDL